MLSLTVSARGRVDALARCAQQPDAVAATQRDALRPAMAEHEGVPAVALLPVRADIVLSKAGLKRLSGRPVLSAVACGMWSRVAYLVVGHVEERVGSGAEQVADVAREEVRPQAVLRVR